MQEEEHSQDMKMTRKKKFNSGESLEEESEVIADELIEEVLN